MALRSSAAVKDSYNAVADVCVALVAEPFVQREGEIVTLFADNKTTVDVLPVRQTNEEIRIRQLFEQKKMQAAIEMVTVPAHKEAIVQTSKQHISFLSR